MPNNTDLTTGEVAELLGVTRRRVYELRDVIGGVERRGRDYFYNRYKVLEFAARRAADMKKRPDLYFKSGNKHRVRKNGTETS